MGAPVQMNPEVRDLVYRGATARQLGLMFQLATASVETRLAKCNPNGERNGLPIYRVVDAAPYLARLPASLVERVVRMNHKDLPPMLTKEYWQGQQAQLKVKAEIGELWRTASVIEYVGSAFRDIRTEILLMADSVERDTVLTEPQRETLMGLIENALRSIQERLRLSFMGAFDDPDGRDATGVLEPQPEPEEDPFHGL